MIITLGREIIYLGILGVTPLFWFRANEGERVLQLIREKQYPDIVAFMQTHENIFRLLLTSGIASITAGVAYLQLPLKVFIGWLPGVGRLDTFFAKLCVLVGAGSLAGAFWWEERKKDKK
jgi:hypothetical protein